MVREVSGSARITKILLELQQLNTEEGLALGLLFSHLGSRGHAFLLIFFSLPFFLPIPVPGLSLILGVIMACVAVAWTLRKSPWLPNRWKSALIPGPVAKRIFYWGLKIATFVEKFARPRGAHFFAFLPVRIMIGFLLALCALLLALPLPPGTNFPPALTIFLFSLSILEEDFLMALLGMAVFIANVVLFWELSIKLLEFIRGPLASLLQN